MLIKINNFRCVKEITLDTTNPVCLSGDNESGKTSVIKAIELLLVGGGNAKKYIRTGAKDFRVACYLDDIDKTVVRYSKGYKIFSGNALEKDADGQLETNIEKLNGNDTPEPIQKIFNLTRNTTTNTIIGSRGYTNAIPFVETSSADNYNIVSEELGASKFRNASNLAHTEIFRLEKSKKVYHENLESLERQKQLAEEELAKQEELRQTLSTSEGIHDSLISVVKAINNLNNLKEQVGNITDLPDEIDTEIVGAIENVKSCVRDYKVAKEEMSSVEELPDEINIDILMAIESLKATIQAYKSAMEQVANTQKELDELKESIKAQNIENMNICPVCGAILINGECLDE